MIESAAFLTWMLWPTFWGFALGFVIWSLGRALSNDTSEAYLYEAMDSNDDFDKVYGLNEAIAGARVFLAFLWLAYLGLTQR